MGRKNSRDRQQRLQRKRNKRSAARRDRHGGEGGGGGLKSRELMAGAVIMLLQSLLAGDPLESDMLQMARGAREEVGALGDLPAALHGFLFEGKPWTVTCEELDALREDFEEHDSTEVFERLWSLALTNEPDPALFAAYETDDELQQVAAAYDELRVCLDDPKRSSARAVRTIAEELAGVTFVELDEVHGKMLRTMLSTVHATPAKRPALLTKLARELTRTFELADDDDMDERATWQFGKVFLREALKRLQTQPEVRQHPGYPEIVKRLLPAPEAAVELTRISGSPESLRAVPLSDGASEWSTYLARMIDLPALPFDERVRYEVARLKLLRTQGVGSDSDDDGSLKAILAAFQGLNALLHHGVPPQFRTIPLALAAPLVDFYIELLDSMRCEARALRVTEELLQAHPEDFRLACLYATGVVQKTEHAKLKLLAKKTTWRHLDPELFARAVRSWSKAPRGMKAIQTLRVHLFDPLDREDRKQCLIALLKQTLRRANGLSEHQDELRYVQPFVPRDSFLYSELRQKTALESSLVFLATMLAPLQGFKLTLTEGQSQQWVSQAREIARQSSFGAELVQQHIRHPRSFVLFPSVAQDARARIEEFQPPRAAPTPPPTPAPPKPRRKRATRKKATPQRDIFDATDP